MLSNYIVIRAKTGNYSGTPCRMVSPNNCGFNKTPLLIRGHHAAWCPRIKGSSRRFVGRTFAVILSASVVILPPPVVILPPPVVILSEAKNLFPSVDKTLEVS
jgi:hypothetical protein